MFNRVFYTIMGGFFGLIIPLSWLLNRAHSARKSWWETWLKTEFGKNGETYALLAFWAAIIFGVIGYLLGRRYDHLERTAKNAQDSNYELEELATTDGLTQLFNARYVHERLAIDVENAHERLAPLCCLLIDIDHFKKINDNHGHPFGDAVLVSVARILRRMVRRMDAVGRLGGEEFMVIMPNTPQEAAMSAAQRIREAVELEEFSSEGKPVRVTVSVGVVRFPSPELRDKEGLLKAVDEALYAAKKSGRNRVLTWPV